MANNGRLQYRVLIPEPTNHQIHVELEVSSRGAALDLTLPAWIPGSYMIRDFARNILEITATDANGSYHPAPVDKQTWRLRPAAGPVLVGYSVYANDLSVRGAHVDDRHAYFNGPCVFLRVVGLDQAPHDVLLEKPGHATASDWRVATTLPAREVDADGFGRYSAPDYASLIDYPIEISDFESVDFEVEGVPHRVVLTGVQKADLARIGRDLLQICSVQASIFGPPLPLERYLFQVTVVGDGYGGLEHRDSTSLICSRKDLPLAGKEGEKAGYRRFLGLCAHEYFHLWNVKRIRPAGLAQTDLSSEAYTRQLWAFEGFTSYYDDLALVRAGVVEPSSYLELLAQTITRLIRSRGRLRQSVSESSFFAWTKFYKQDENASNAIVSYYVKGALIALGLDVQLRLATAGERDLDSLLRLLWSEFGKRNRPVPEGEIEARALAMAGSDLDGFFDRYVHGTEELPLESWLAELGVGMRLRPSSGGKDIGGIAPADAPVPAPGKSIGAVFEAEPQGARVTRVVEGSPAQRGGLAVGDLVVALDGLRVIPDDLVKNIAESVAEEPLEFHGFRRDELRVFRVQPEPAPADTCDLWLMENAGLPERVLNRRAAWLWQRNRA
jgi:predicted metalloprotease with PDZ domain